MSSRLQRDFDARSKSAHLPQNYSLYIFGIKIICADMKKTGFLFNLQTWISITLLWRFLVYGFRNAVQDWVILSWRVFPNIPFFYYYFIINVIKSTLVSVLLIGLHQSIILLQTSLVSSPKAWKCPFNPQSALTSLTGQTKRW